MSAGEVCCAAEEHPFDMDSMECPNCGKLFSWLQGLKDNFVLHGSSSASESRDKPGSGKMPQVDLRLDEYKTKEMCEEEREAMARYEERLRCPEFLAVEVGLIPMMRNMFKSDERRKKTTSVAQLERRRRMESHRLRRQQERDSCGCEISEDLKSDLLSCLGLNEFEAKPLPHLLPSSDVLDACRSRAQAKPRAVLPHNLMLKVLRRMSRGHCHDSPEQAAETIKVALEGIARRYRHPVTSVNILRDAAFLNSMQGSVVPEPSDSVVYLDDQFIGTVNETFFSTFDCGSPILRARIMRRKCVVRRDVERFISICFAPDEGSAKTPTKDSE